jgi:hypothetical protein
VAASLQACLVATAKPLDIVSVAERRIPLAGELANDF